MDEFHKEIIKRGITRLGKPQAQLLYARCKRPNNSLETLVEKLPFSIHSARNYSRTITDTFHLNEIADIDDNVCQLFYEVAGDPPDWENWPPRYTPPPDPDYEGTISTLKKQLREQLNKHKQTLEELKRQRAINDSYKEQLEDYKKQLEDSEREVERLSNKISQLEAEAESLRSTQSRQSTGSVSHQSFWDGVADRQLPDVPLPLISIAIFIIVFVCIWFVWALVDDNGQDATPSNIVYYKSPTPSPGSPEPTTPSPTATQGAPIVITDTPTPGGPPTVTPTPYPLPFTDDFDGRDISTEWLGHQGDYVIIRTDGDGEITNVDGEEAYLLFGDKGLSNYYVAFDYRENRGIFSLIFDNRRFRPVTSDGDYYWERFIPNSGWARVTEAKYLPSGEGRLKFEMYGDGRIHVEHNNASWFDISYGSGPVGDFAIRLKSEFLIDNVEVDYLD